MTSKIKKFYNVNADTKSIRIVIPAVLAREFKITNKSKVRWGNRNGKLFASIDK